MHSKKIKPAIVVHTGAGYESIVNESAEREYKKGIYNALKKGYSLLQQEKSALDAAEKTCSVLEDNPLFNAGYGSVLNSQGFVEMDAAIMDGKTLKFGSVSNITKVKNPISLARRLIYNDRYAFLTGKGAENIALLENLEVVENEYFITKSRIEQLNHVKFKKRSDSVIWNELNEADIIKNYGTVGVVCLDVYGNIATATSTGGTNNKPLGRVGDSPIIGAGTYANNETCGVSCTGKGEYILKTVNAFKIHALMKYKKLCLEDACFAAIEELRDLDAHAGFIALDQKGNVVTMYDTAMMGRGFIKEGKCEIYVYDKDKDLTETNFCI